MALILADRVQETTATTGTGTITLAGAVVGYQAFSSIGNGNTTYYAITSGANWEVGIGTYTLSGTTLSRDTVLSSSNAGAKISLTSLSNVFVTYPAERAITEGYGTLPVANGGTGATIAATARTNLSAAASGANTDITSIALTSGTVSTAPASNNDLANKQYVDTVASSGIHFHQPVRVESPTNLNATYNNGTAGVGATLTNAGTQAALVLDGVTVSVADRVLIYTQTNATQNGIYVVTTVGSVSTNWVLTRSSDADTYVNASPSGLSEGSTVFVQQGTTGAGETYTCNTLGTITFGTTNITFAQISSAQIYSAGTGLTLTGTQFSLTTPVAIALGGTGAADAATALTNLGAYPAANPSGYTSNTGTVTSVTGTGTVNGMTLTGSVTSSGSLTLGGTLSNVDLSSQVTGTLPVGNGGTGVTTSTGSGNVVLSSSPTLVTPTLGVASATSVATGLGAVGTPSYTFAGDLNTGMWSPTADTLAFSTNGAEVARLTSAGYLEAVYSDEVVALGNSGTATTIDLRQGNVFTATLTGNCTFTLSNPNANSSRGTSFTLILTNDATAGRTVAWAGGTFRFPGGAATLGRTTAANGVDIWVFFTPNNGTTYYGNIAMKNMIA